MSEWRGYYGWNNTKSQNLQPHFKNEMSQDCHGFQKYGHC